MASYLRRRISGDSKQSHVKEVTFDQPDKARHEPVSKTVSPKKVKGAKRRNGFIFFLGGLAGIVAAGLFAKNNDLIELPELGELSMDSLLDILPAGFVKDATDLVVSYPQFPPLMFSVADGTSQRGERETINYDSFSVGLNLLAQGVRANHPVVMVPGVISTGLESWGTSNKSRPYFRKRLWGSWTMMRALVLNKDEWKQHIMLDKYTGLDPPDIKLRAAQGFDATDFFITGYWIVRLISKGNTVVLNYRLMDLQ
jgi:phospholipid:diacylglycerol acyltransferase